jgi:uncharacterized membrane protein YphA (DoxX/SURF4 family)
MKKRNKIVYWVATLWLALGMTSSGVVQIIHLEEEVERLALLGYPAYFLTLIGIWKLLGVVAVLAPRMPLLKEWAYAGFLFVMSGAIFSHLAMGDEAVEFFGPTLLLILIVVSWYLRPEDRRIVSGQDPLASITKLQGK